MANLLSRLLFGNRGWLGISVPGWNIAVPGMAIAALTLTFTVYAYMGTISGHIGVIGSFRWYPARFLRRKV